MSLRTQLEKSHNQIISARYLSLCAFFSSVEKDSFFFLNLGENKATFPSMFLSKFHRRLLMFSVVTVFVLEVHYNPLAAVTRSLFWIITLFSQFCVLLLSSGCLPRPRCRIQCPGEYVLFICAELGKLMDSITSKIFYFFNVCACVCCM